MAEGRFISRTIAFSEQLGHVSLEADYLFMRMLPHLDCEGRLTGSPKSIRAHVCPLRDDMANENVSAALAELDQARLINWYEVDGMQCVEYPNFGKHQVGLRKNREAVSKVPSSASLGATRIRTAQPIPPPAVDSSGATPADSGSPRDNSKGSEVKGSEVKLSSAPSATPHRDSLTEDERSVVDHYLTTHPRRRIDDKLARKFITPALKQFSVDELRLAIDGNATDSWCREHNKQELGYVLRNADLISGFIEKASPVPQILNYGSDESLLHRAMGTSV